MHEWLTDYSILHIPLWNWLLAIAVGSAAFLVFVIFLRIAVARIKALALRRPSKGLTAAAELLSGTNWYLLFFVSVIIGLNALNLSTRWTAVISHLWFIVLALQIGLWAGRAVNIWHGDHLSTNPGTNPVTATLIALLAQAVVWITVFLSVLDNAGVNITALVASLGIGGVAVALAVQTVLSDLFASISIGVDKPFEVGDFIVVGGGSTMGSIERIGLKSTRIRSLGGEQIICSNTELLKQTIQNFKRMNERRVVFRFNLPYRTSPDKVAMVPAIVKDIVTSNQPTRFDSAHFFNFRTAALELEVVYYVLDADYNRYMDIQQNINLNIMRKLAENDIEFALPERTVTIVKNDSEVAEKEARSGNGAFQPRMSH